LTLSAEAAIALGLPDKAEPLLREVLGRAPDFAHAQHALGNALILMDRLQEARRVLTDLLARTPRDGALLALLASTARDLGDFEAALMHGKQLIALNEK